MEFTKHSSRRVIDFDLTGHSLSFDTTIWSSLAVQAQPSKAVKKASVCCLFCLTEQYVQLNISVW